ncbi:PR-1-like protein [Mycena indigotica]|uniref:PR-1-like protein n=1 Tax=Mycena indigotica TaxID=2126181 RepID=A0A8H6SS47_9AGAR|nr:PR-1-like protein [Mycena indigotica]KAF7303387.1 PR-1-like protein [Mycena indigotica]
MAGPRPRSLPLLAVLLAAAAAPCSPPCSPTATTRAPTTAASAPATAAPPAPSPRAAPPPTSGGAVNATPKPSTTAAPPPRTPPPRHRHRRPRLAPRPQPRPRLRLRHPQRPPLRAPPRPRRPRPTGPALPAGAINAGAAVAPARLRSGPGAVPQVPQRHPRQPQGRPPLVERHALRRGPEGRGHVRVRALGREGRPVRARTSRAGTGKYGIEKAIVSWTNEVGDYDPKNPVPSHFTQVVWRGTTQVGCALTVCAPGTIFDPKFTNTAEYYVCEYAPPGNIIGQFDQMVSV